MLYPNLYRENRLRRQGFKYIAGLDEVGRGAWAGPLVAAAVILDPKIRIKGIKDSKLLRPVQRKELSNTITQSALAWAVGIISEKTIDKIGLTKANMHAMALAVKNLTINPDFLLIDAVILNYLKTPSLSITKGDYKVTSIAAASIIAKVARDQIMEKLADSYPIYGFEQHKGYGTAFHHRMVYQHGICQVHRQSFGPIKYFIK